MNDKVDSLGRSLEETQERTRQNEGKISEVDQKRAGGGSSAAKAADDRPCRRTAQRRRRPTRGNGANAQGRRSRQGHRSSSCYEVVLSEDQGNFKFGKTELPDEAKAKLDEMIEQLKADPKGVFFEIEGHTDNVGDKVINEKLGMERAEAVKRYLYEQHQIPLHKMNVISYGEEKPVAPNKTKDGRAQNRRVVIKVLS